MHFNGVTNYINLFKDPLFWKALSNTLLIGIIAHIPILLGGLALAYILNSKLVKGENIFKTIYFMPMVTSSVAISIIFQTMFGRKSDQSSCYCYVRMEMGRLEHGYLSGRYAGYQW